MLYTPTSFVRAHGSDYSEAIYVRDSMFLGDTDILKCSCTNKYIRNIITGGTATYKSLL